MRRIVTTAVAIALMGGAALSAPAVAAGPADRARPRPAPARPASCRPPTSWSSPPSRPCRSRVGRADGLRDARDRPPGPGGRCAAPRPVRDAGAARPLDEASPSCRGRATARSPTPCWPAPPTAPATTRASATPTPRPPPICNTRLCVHYVADRHRRPAVARLARATNLAVMDSVWTTEVDQIGYRAPLTRRRPAAAARSSTSTSRTSAATSTASAPVRTGPRSAPPRATACSTTTSLPPSSPTARRPTTWSSPPGHEFFHAVQYAYDYAEDPWMMESTATWMEERIATAVNDNRQYLPGSQIYAPYVPLDAFSRTDGFQYGNWVFWEYLTATLRHRHRARRPGSRPARSRRTAARTASPPCRRCSSARAA